MTSLANLKKPSLVEENLDLAFPTINPGVYPVGSGILVQIKSSATVTKAGLHLLRDAVDTENDTTQVAKVIAMGPVAFCNRDTGKLWVEGKWCAVGSFIRIPIHTQNAKSWSIPVPGRDSRVSFTIIEDLQVVGLQADPFYPRAYL